MSKKIAVIGAGVSGLLAALANVEKGFQVTVFEKQDFPPMNPSTIAGGMMAPFSEIETLPMQFVRTALRGITQWREIWGEDAGLYMQEEGSLFLAHREDDHMLDRFSQHLGAVTTDWRWVDGAGIAGLEPGLSGRYRRGLYIPQEAHILPVQALEALARKLANLGGRVEQREVEPEDLSEDYDWVIDCRGYVVEVDQELRGVKGEIILVRNLEFSLKRPVRLMHPRYPLYIVPRPDHVFAVGATAIENAEEEDGLVMLRSAMELMSAVYSLHPSFGEAEIVDMISGIRAAYRDNLPRIIIDGEKRTIRSNGLFRHGYLLSPVMARCAADYIETGEENEDYALFSGRVNYAAFQ